MTIKNEMGEHATVFCRAFSWENVFVDPGLSQNITGSHLDCRVSHPGKCVDTNGATLVFQLNHGQSSSIYLAQNARAISGTCWMQTTAAFNKQSMGKGPAYISQVEFTA